MYVLSLATCLDAGSAKKENLGGPDPAEVKEDAGRYGTDTEGKHL